MNFLEKIEAMMREKNITRGELAKASGIPYTTIVAFWEKGYEGSRLSTLRKLADFFECTIDFLASNNISEKENLISLNDLIPSEYRMMQIYKRAKECDKDDLRVLLKAIDIILKQYESNRG